MDTNNFFSFSRIAMVMKREIMENWKTNLYRLIGIYAAFALVMILHMWTMSSGRSSQISFTAYCSNIHYFNVGFINTFISRIRDTTTSLVSFSIFLCSVK